MLETDPLPPTTLSIEHVVRAQHRSFRASPVLVWGGIALFFLVVALVVAINAAMYFTGVPIDGPFQLYDALRRIAAGFRPGIDFQFFHGLGIPYLHYWLFKLFGGGLEGSELARNLVSPVIFVAVLVAFFRVFGGTWTRCLCLTATALALVFTFRVSSLFSFLLFAVNGSLGVRSALPILLPAALFISRTRTQRVVAGGGVLGLALFFGTEQGLAALLAYAVVSAIAAMRREKHRGQVIESAATIGLGMLVLVACLTSVAGVTGMRGALRYNFGLIPADQYWFFGAPPNVFVPSWYAGLLMVAASWQICFALVLVGIVMIVYVRRLWRDADGRAGARRFALAVLPLYGLISCASLLGVFTAVYVQPCWRTILLAGLLEWMALLDRHPIRRGAHVLLGVPRIAALAGITLSVLTLLSVPVVQAVVFYSFADAVHDHVLTHQPFAMNSFWIETLADGQRVIDGHRGPHGEPPVLWSTYAGWIEARNDLFNPSFDYVIHALGTDNRTTYDNGLRTVKPTLVQTVRPTFTQYEPWIENADWPFYDELLRSYKITAVTPWSFYWDRRTTPGPEPEVIGEAQLPPGMAGLPLPPIPPRFATPLVLLEVEIEYDTKNPLGWLPIVGKSPRYFVGIEGAVTHLPVSLDPFVRTTRFPVVMKAGQHPFIYFRTTSLLPGARLTPRKIRVYARTVDGLDQPWLDDLVARLGK